jgi:hypothetical protein
MNGGIDSSIQADRRSSLVQGNKLKLQSRADGASIRRIGSPKKNENHEYHGKLEHMYGSKVH